MPGHNGGAKPKPTALKLLTGSRRPINPNEPDAGGPLGDPPRFLPVEARRKWRQMAPDLEAMGVAGKMDRDALALYCQTWADYVQALADIAKYGTLIKSPNGMPVQSPYVGMKNRALDTLRALAGEFGLTPSSRTRIHATPPGGKQKSALEELLSSRPSLAASGDGD